MRNGRPIGTLHDTVDQVTREHGIGSYEIQKLHPVSDLELINKIKATFS
jgi:hypothetical protein